MLPNLNIPSLKLFGPVEIHPFGVLVAIAVVLGFYLSQRRAAKVGLDPKLCYSGMTWGVISGFVFAHWIDAIFYYPERIVEDPFYLLRLWDGISSFGGFIGGALGVFVYFHRRKLSVLEYAEAIMFGLVPAWAIGRLGCTIVFDHPGLPTDFILGMQDGHGVVRHNLGFYEMLAALFLTGLIYFLKNTRPFRGFYIALVMALYAPVRFFLDFLRVADKTYYGFTPGQYLSVLMLFFAMGWIAVGWFGRKARHPELGVPSDQTQ